MVSDHHTQMPHVFLWFLSMMHNSHMNSHGLDRYGRCRNNSDDGHDAMKDDSEDQHAQSHYIPSMLVHTVRKVRAKLPYSVGSFRIFFVYEFIWFLKIMSRILVNYMFLKMMIRIPMKSYVFI